MGSNNKSSENNLFGHLSQSSDFVQYIGETYEISYIRSLVKADTLHTAILPYLKTTSFRSFEETIEAIPVNDVIVTQDQKKIQEKILIGFVAYKRKDDDKIALIEATDVKTRQVTIPEVEFSVVGPKEAFVESISTNINLVRKRLPISSLVVKTLTMGTKSKTSVAVLYIEDVANKENINTVFQRLNDIEFDHINDSSYITQMISDNGNSIFPQLIDTERPDRIAAILNEGKIAIIVDGSPQVLYGPTTIVEFFSAFEDYFLVWPIASIFRLIRLFSVLFSFFATPLYVGVMTYHYELIPMDLMGPLIISRAVIPFPPIIETIVLELTIELLREAGARLPTKVGQTIGIVGGIVIGTASVEAGLTSNVLLILVALAALASFTTPVYRMSNTIRLIRFPLILLAAMWGLIGITIGFVAIIVHLVKLTSFGRPYLEPLFPPRFADLKDSFIRLPYSVQSMRPVHLQSEDTKRFNKKKKSKDIDE